MIGASEIDYLAKGVLQAMYYGLKRNVTEEQAKNIIERGDWSGVFTEQEVCGYGVYDRELRKDEETGQYYVVYSIGSSCD